VILLLATLARFRREDLSLQVFWLAVVMLLVSVKDWFVVFLAWVLLFCGLLVISSTRAFM
jgi:hypothetical protein